MEYKKVLLLQVDSIMKYPPTISLIHELDKLGKEVYVFTTQVDEHLKNVLPKKTRLIKIGNDYKYSASRVHKVIELINIRKECWRQIDRYYDTESILWIMSNITIKHLGDRLLKYNYNLHLFELVDSLYYFGKFRLAKINLKELCKRANKVIVCEYNRAHITKTWFELENLPIIITNKAAPNKIEKKSSIIHDKKGKEVLQSINGKKIILYQGIVDKERPIEIIAEAIEQLSDEFVFLVMTGSCCDQLKRYKKTIVIPFVAPPYHLEITSHAYIGILIYTPVYGSFSSPLNAIYCAPNKLYEYSQFGLPMMGNDIPGLKYTIEYKKMGICVEKLEIEEIKKAIKVIEDSYGEYSKNAQRFYKQSSNEMAIIEALTIKN